MQAPTQESGAVDRAKLSLRRMIGDGDLVPGQRLAEPDLSALLDISRPTLREAFRALEAEGLVRIERYKGASVRRVERGEVVELFELREVLEGLAARRAAHHLCKAPGKARLMAVFQDMEAAAAGKQHQRFTALNGDFHQLILLAADSERLLAMAGHAQPPGILRMVHQRLLDDAAVQRSLNEHRTIYQALIAGDAERAENAMRRHIRSSMKSLERMVNGRSGGKPGA